VSITVSHHTALVFLEEITMGMQETPRSLRTYFVLVGVFGLLGNAAELWQSQRLGLAYAIDGAIGACLAVAFLYSAFKLTALLKGGGRPLVQLLIVSAIYRARAIVLLALVGGKTGDFIGPVLGIAVSIYLISNVRRLARGAGYVEAQ
jgi:hypothetical protein